MAADSSSLECGNCGSRGGGSGGGSGGGDCGAGGCVRRVTGCGQRRLFVGMVSASSFVVFFLYSVLAIKKTDYGLINIKSQSQPFRFYRYSSNSTPLPHSNSNNVTNAHTNVTNAPTNVTVAHTNVTVAPTNVTVAHTNVTVAHTNVTVTPTNVTAAHTNVVSAAQQSKSPTDAKGKESSAAGLYSITIVTAYYDIGEFNKGSSGYHKRNWTTYQNWSSAFKKIRAPVVMYTNSQAFANFFSSVRRNLSDLTKVLKVKEDDIWAFSLKPRIAAIYASGYPRFWPNTANPAYTCVTHAKFDFLQDTVDKGYFPSRQVAWMDMGYLRDIVGGKEDVSYIAYPPRHFAPRRVMCGQIVRPDFQQSWRNILHRNKNWVAGGFFLATPEVMTKFVKQYRQTVLAFLRLGESQVEQAILYATYTDEGRKIVRPTVELQVIRGDWFDVGFSCLHLVYGDSSYHPLLSLSLCLCVSVFISLFLFLVVSRRLKN